jgi:hypothetical protein
MNSTRAVRDRWRRAVMRVYCGDFGVNQAAEVGGLVAGTIAVGAAISTHAPSIAGGIATFWNNQLPG